MSCCLLIEVHWNDFFVCPTKFVMFLAHPFPWGVSRYNHSCTCVSCLGLINWLEAFFQGSQFWIIVTIGDHASLLFVKIEMWRLHLVYAQVSRLLSWYHEVGHLVLYVVVVISASCCLWLDWVFSVCLRHVFRHDVSVLVVAIVNTSLGQVIM